MRAADAHAAAAGEVVQYGVGLGLLGSHGQPQRHYPDLMLDTSGGHRVAVELELTAKSSRRMARIMTGYASDASVDAVALPGAHQRTRCSSSRMPPAARGSRDLVHMQRIAPDGIPVGVTTNLANTRVRSSQAAWRGHIPSGQVSQRSRRHAMIEDPPPRVHLRPCWPALAGGGVHRADDDAGVGCARAVAAWRTGRKVRAARHPARALRDAEIAEASGRCCADRKRSAREGRA